jgi:hypothetical protein
MGFLSEFYNEFYGSQMSDKPMAQQKPDLKKLEEKFEALFKEETEDSFNKWLADKQQQNRNNMAQQTAVGLLLTKIPNAAEIKEFISNNDADEKMLDEWLFERIYQGVDYKQMEKQQIMDAYKYSYGVASFKTGTTSEQYYTQTYTTRLQNETN